MNAFRKLHPAHWGVRTYVTVIIVIGILGILTGCTPAKPDSLSDECAQAVAARMLDGRDDDITNADVDRYFDEECEVSR